MYKQKDSIILVADDEDRFREALVDALRFFGYEVVEAKTGQEIERQIASILEKQKPYALIVDNQMPENVGEPEKQWCGFQQIVKLCSAYPGSNIDKHVIFLSRWGLADLPEQLKKDAETYGLLQRDQWWYVYTPYTTLKGPIERILTLEDDRRGLQI